LAGNPRRPTGLRVREHDRLAISLRSLDLFAKAAMPAAMA
jgi:hypothetical protein